jgi:plastocyanin
VITACTGTTAAIVNAVGQSNGNPADVTINVNDAVRWNNNATGVDHTVTSMTVPANGTFNVAPPNNTSIRLTFTAAGTCNYRCTSLDHALRS